MRSAEGNASELRSRSADWLPSRKLAFVVLCGLLLMHCVLYLDNAIDDAYVSYRYARSLVEGHGLTFNPGERVEGFSNPLWVFLGAGALSLGFEDPHIVMQLLGIACGTATLLLLFSLGTRLFARHDRRWACLPPVLLCVQGSFPGYACSGMETPLYVFLLVWGLHRLVCAKPDVMVGLIFGLAALTRPEAPFHAALLTGAAYLFARREGKRWKLRGLIWAGAGFAGLFGGWVVFRLAYFGELVPNTYYARSGVPLSTMWNHGLAYLLLYLRSVHWAPVVALVVLVANRNWSLMIWGVAWLAAAVAIVHLGGDWMAQFRFFAHIAFLEVILLTGGFIALFALVRRWGARCALAVALAAALSVAGLATSRSVEQAPSIAAGGRAIRERYRAIGIWLREQRDVQVIALVDVGALAYYSRARIIDLAGLTDKTIARSPGRLVRKEYDPVYVLAKEPDLVIMHSSGPAVVDRTGAGPKLVFKRMFGSETRLLNHHDFVRNYRYVTSFTIGSEKGRSSYHQHVFSRHGVDVDLDLQATRP